ncbi:MAG TPA: helix-turn-helix domain-containing protein [Acidimicrobiales bacterium]
MPEPVPTKATRRRRGEPRRLLLAAARDLFARQDYRSTTTREIAEQAGVAEHLLFRNFGSKAALFREALVVPFIDVVDAFSDEWPTISPETAVEEEVAAGFLGSLYDLFVANRGLVMTLLAADALSDEELEESGIRDISDALAVIGRIGAEGIDLKGLHSQDHELAARSTMAMVAGMAAFGKTFFGGRPPSRDAIVRELALMSLHGFLHREGQRPPG